MNIFETLKKQRKDILKAKAVTRALDNKTRMDMLEILAKKDRASVTDIYFSLRMEQSIVSQHLAILRNTKVVTTERDGKNIYYSINETVLSHYLNVLSALDAVNLPGRLPGSINMHKPDELKHYDGPGGEGEGEKETADTQGPGPEATQQAAGE